MKDEAFEMHEWFCADEAHKNFGPCLFHELTKSKPSPEEHRAKGDAINAQVPRELGAKQNEHMHDEWCKQEAHSAGAYCEGFKRKTEAKEMQEWFCSRPEHSQYGPCLRHKKVQELGEEADPEILKAEFRKIDQIAPDGEAQHEEMHDDWCARPEKADDSFCIGWAEHKKMREREL